MEAKNNDHLIDSARYMFSGTAHSRIAALERVCDYLTNEVDSYRDRTFLTILLAATAFVIAILAFVRSAHAERPAINISDRTYSHPASVKIVSEADGWQKCGLDKNCLGELAANIGKDTRTLVFFESPRSFYVDSCIGNELCYAGGPAEYINRAVNATYGWNESEGDVSRESVEDDFNFSINYQCQYLRRKAHRRIGRVANPSECYKRLASQSRRECIRDLFSPRYSCGYHKGETKNQWSAFVVERD